MANTIATNKRIAYFRARKAQALTDMLVALEVSPSEASAFTAEDWQKAAQAAKVNVLSADTVALILSQLESAYDAAF